MDNQPSRSWRFLLVVFGALFALHLVLYIESFHVKPAGDDFSAPLTEVLRGQREGPASFFTKSAQSQNYRPILSLLVWAFGSISYEHRVPWIHVLSSICLAIYAVAALLWLRLMPIGRAGVIAAAAMFFLHPVLVTAVAGTEGAGGPLAVAFMWLGAIAVIHFRDRLAVAVPLVMICFWIGGLTKEYSFGLGPLAVWTALVFSRTHRWRNAFVIGAALSVALAALMIARHYTIPPGLNAGLDYIHQNPLNWAKNAGLLGTSLVFMGSTVWVMLRADAIAFAALIVLSMALLAVVVPGLWWRWSNRQVPGPTADVPTTDPVDSPRHWIVYLLIAFPLAGATPLLTQRASEMYAVGLVLPFALLFGMAVDGWWRRGRSSRNVCAVACVTLLLIAAVSVTTKISLMRQAGEKAEVNLRLLLEALPADANGVNVAVLMRQSEILAQERYSVYVLNDYAEMAQPYAIDWIAPERHIVLAPMLVDMPDLNGLEHFDHVLLWRPDIRQYERLR